MSRDLVRRYAFLPVPRYAAYPPASAFDADIGAHERAAWLAALGHGDPLSLYLHVPRCPEVCLHCGRATRKALRNEVLTNYRRLLAREIALVARHLQERPRVTRLHWGGGAPSLLGADALGALVADLSTTFDLAAGVDHAITLDPRAITADLAWGLVRSGVNRADLRIGDPGPGTPVVRVRARPAGGVEAAITHLRAAGLYRLSVDFIHGFPGETPATVAAAAHRIALMGPDRVAFRAYAHLPRRERNRHPVDAAALPGPADLFRQAEAVRRTLLAMDYETAGADHYARPDDGLALAARDGRLRRDLQGYTDDRAEVQLGFGASAVSRFREGCVQNLPDPTTYASALWCGRLPSARGRRFTAEDRARGAVVEALLCGFRADLAPYGGLAGFPRAAAALEPMVRDGLVDIEGDAVAVTPEGRPFVRVIASAFDTCAPRAPADLCPTM